jgi:hypothetical protein
LQGHRLLLADAGDDGGRQRHQVTGQAAEPIGLAHRIAHLDNNGLAVDVAELFERSAKRVELRRFGARVGAHQDADARNPVACCATAALGPVSAAPPRAARNLRRFTR